MSDRRVLLCSPPMRSPEDADLGLATVKALLQNAGIAVDALHGTLLFPFTQSDSVLRGLYAAFYFAPFLHPDVTPQAAVEVALDTFLADSNMQGLRLAPESASFTALELGSRAAFARDALADVERAGVCIDRCVERAAAERYDIVGFSCTFEMQVVAGLAIAKRLKQLRPEMKIVFGGAACFGETADELARVFRFVDVVCHSEGDDVVIPLVRALRGEGQLADVPGISWIDETNQARRTAAPPLLTDLDRLPLPDYDSYMEQLAASEWSHRPPKIYFETSRGCWWGQKHLCTFCGLNAEGLTYRKKSPERAFEDIRQLHERYPTAYRLHCSDNILDMDYLRTVLPRIAAHNRGEARPMRLFWEIKSNLRRDQVAVLAEAGTDCVQPGIESFSDEVLKLMRKGSNGLGQVQNIKYLYEYGIESTYQIIIANPNEGAEAYREMTALIPFLKHLPPPCVNLMELQRFSPYFLEPHEHGISNLRPKPYYQLLYGHVGADLGKLAYRFDYDHPSFHDAELIAAQREFVAAVIDWYSHYQAKRAWLVDESDHLTVVDRRGGALRSARIAGSAAELYRYLDQPRAWTKIQQRFPELSAPALRALLDTWLRRRWICRDRNDRFLAVLPQLDEAAGRVARPPAPIARGSQDEAAFAQAAP